jgi:hypothetical protein
LLREYRRCRPIVQSWLPVHVPVPSPITAGESAIELSIDNGEIDAGGKTKPICEVELELKSGQPGDLFRIAKQLAEEVSVQRLGDLNDIVVHEKLSERFVDVDRGAHGSNLGCAKKRSRRAACPDVRRLELGLR